MRAIELSAFAGVEGLRAIEAATPKPGPSQVLIKVKASGINFAELELAKGRYPYGKKPPFIMGFEAAGIVLEPGREVTNLKAGDRVTAVVSSGGYAEYATAEEAACIPIPDGISFAEATTIPIQGLTAYALLYLAAKPRASESVLIQAAAGGVGLYLVQLAKIMGAHTVVALASSLEKMALLESLGADFAIDYSSENWPDRVREALGGKGPDVVLEAASGEVGRKSFELLAPFGRMVVFGARNIHDTILPEQVRQLIVRNQTLTGFNIPSLTKEMIAPLVSPLLELIAQRKIRIFAEHSFPLTKVTAAFEALASRRTIGKVVLIP